MTNKEKYQRTFSALHASDDCLKEVIAMKQTKKIHMSRLAAVCAAAVLVLGLTCAAYAADVGGIQRTVQIWVNGDQTDAVFDMTDDGSYTLRWQDEEGTTHERGGGGIAYEPDGSERPLTEEELLEEMDSPEVAYLDDGSVWVYYRDQGIEITDRFDDDGVCYVQVTKVDGEVLYMTIEYQRCFSASAHGYLPPSGS